MANERTETQLLSDLLHLQEDLMSVYAPKKGWKKDQNAGKQAVKFDTEKVDKPTPDQLIHTVNPEINGSTQATVGQLNRSLHPGKFNR